jgi:CheY-like chemotaxis protein
VSSQKSQGSVFTIRFPVRLGEDAPAGGTDRSAMLSRSRVLLLAPLGPAAQATVATIEALGGRCRHVANSEDVTALIDRAASGAVPFTDLIVDHRLASGYACEPLHRPLHRILLVNPEERASQPQELFDAWLIRPLREKSLVDVLSGRLRGFASATAPSALDDTRPQQPSGPAGDPAGMGRDRSHLDVILAEDDPISATLVRAMLQRDGHRVRWVADAQGLADALRQAGGHTDLIITDMNMPGGDPLNVITEFRLGDRSLDARAIPVIVLTGDAREEVVQRALDAGARNVLQKPVNPVTLMENIRLMLADEGRRQQAR